MSELTDRILRVTEDLQVIQETLSAAAAPGAPPEVRERIMEDLLDKNMITELKAAVDHMRHLLWSYIEASSNKNPHMVTRTLQAVRMQRVTEMLKILQPGVAEARESAMPEAQSFFDAIQRIAASAVEKHGTGQQ